MEEVDEEDILIEFDDIELEREGIGGDAMYSITVRSRLALASANSESLLFQHFLGTRHRVPSIEDERCDFQR